MNSRNTIMLGLGVAIALVISTEVAYGMMGQTAPQQSTYTSSVTGASGYGGGMMGGYGGSTNPGGMGSMMGGGYGGMMGSFGGMMSGYGGMMSGYGGMMSGYGGMMSQFSQFMGNYWNHTQNGTTKGAFVAIVNYGFHPTTLTVSKGTTVTWVNMDFVQHTVTAGTEQAPTNLFDSHELNHMQSFSYTFSTPGTYTYYCDIHPNMMGTIVVTA
jgi:plastocyanin